MVPASSAVSGDLVVMGIDISQRVVGVDISGRLAYWRWGEMEVEGRGY